MIDPRILAAADACVAQMRGQPGAEIDRGQMTEAERKVWRDAACDTYTQLFGELTPRALWDLTCAAAGIPDAPPDHPFYSDGPTMTFVTVGQAGRLREWLNKGKD